MHVGMCKIGGHFVARWDLLQHLAVVSKRPRICHGDAGSDHFQPPPDVAFVSSGFFRKLHHTRKRHSTEGKRERKLTAKKKPPEQPVRPVRHVVGLALVEEVTQGPMLEQLHGQQRVQQVALALVGLLLLVPPRRVHVGGFFHLVVEESGCFRLVWAARCACRPRCAVIRFKFI